MIITPLSIPGAVVVTFPPQSDERGSFSRLFCARELADFMNGHTIAQINKSVNRKTGTVRGLHFQYPPKAEIKLIRCTQGKVFDVMVDIRRESPTFLQWKGVELSADNYRMVIIPEGCAHGFQVLADDSELLYLHSEYFDSAFEGALSVLDPRIGIDWPLPIGEMSERDQGHQYITDDFRGITL